VRDFSRLVAVALCWTLGVQPAVAQVQSAAIQAGIGQAAVSAGVVGAASLRLQDLSGLPMGGLGLVPGASPSALSVLPSVRSLSPARVLGASPSATGVVASEPDRTVISFGKLAGPAPLLGVRNLPGTPAVSLAAPLLRPGATPVSGPAELGRRLAGTAVAASEAVRGLAELPAGGSRRAADLQIRVLTGETRPGAAAAVAADDLAPAPRASLGGLRGPSSRPASIEDPKNGDSPQPQPVPPGAGPQPVPPGAGPQPVPPGAGPLPAKGKTTEVFKDPERNKSWVFVPASG